MLCLSSRNMIDKAMCEVLWRNTSDFYVNLRVEVGKHPQVILAMYFFIINRNIKTPNVRSYPYTANVMYKCEHIFEDVTF